MNNIRISVNFSKVSGTIIRNLKNDNGKTETYVCVPAKAFFVPSENPQPIFMANMIHCPNSMYNDWMIRPYIAAADYKLLSKEEREAVPVIGSGTFVQPQQPQLGKGVQTAEAAPASLTPTQPTQPTHAPAAGLPPTSSSAAPAAAHESAPGRVFYVMNLDNQYVLETDDWMKAQQCSNEDPANRPIIEAWQNGARIARWQYSSTDWSWRQTIG